jgi:hypothetical protein
MIVTEADKIWHDNEPLRAAVNSGYTRGAGVLRCVGDDTTPHLFSTFCPKVIDMLGRDLPDTGHQWDRCGVYMSTQSKDANRSRSRQGHRSGLSGHCALAL